MRKLNEQQHEAVYSNADRILCLAGAGAGKSTVLLTRIARLVKDGVAPNSILALTFTNAAANEMLTRYKKDNPNQATPEFRTFHSFCYHLIVKDIQIRNLLGYASVPEVCDERKMKQTKQKVKLQLGINLPDSILLASDEATLNSLSKKDKQLVEMFNKAVIKQLKVDNLITFDMICYDISQLFVDNSPLIAKYHNQYKYLFVDEFQDTDMRQVKFLSSFKNSKVFIVGDAQQAIYMWRNATNEPLKVFSKSPDWKVIKLFENYRSSKQICAFANKITTYADKDYRIEMHGQFDGAKVAVQYDASSSYTGPAVDLDHLADVIYHLKKLEGTTAVLCRSNREVRFVCGRFRELGIEYKQNKPADMSTEIIASVRDNQYMLDWLSSLLPAEKYAEYIKLSTLVENPDITWFAKTYRDIDDISDYGKKIVAIRKILRTDDYPFMKVQEIVKVLDRKDVLATLDIGDVDDNKDILDQVESLLSMSKEVSCYVGTIHSVKGLEYDNVFVMGVGDTAFPLNTEEMKNLYYVAVTRAKHRLFVYKA